MNNVGPIQSQVYANAILSNVSIAYTNDENVMIADEIFPKVPVKFRTGIYFVYDKSKFRVANDLRSPGQEANVVTYGLTQATYGPLHDHMLKQAIEDELRDQAVAPLDPDIDATENVTSRIMLSKEYDAFLKCTSGTYFTGSNKVTLSGTDQWDDYANSDPIDDVRVGVDTVKAALVGKKPNTMVITYEVFSVLRNHPQILERIKYSQLGIITVDLLAAVFDIKRILVPDVMHNTGNAGQTETAMTYMWGKNVWLFYITPRPAIRTISWGFTLQKGDRQTLTWRDPRPDTFQDWVGVRQYYEHKVIAAAAGYWIATPIS